MQNPLSFLISVHSLLMVQIYLGVFVVVLAASCVTQSAHVRCDTMATATVVSDYFTFRI
jgi:hypothetical protein